MPAAHVCRDIPLPIIVLTAFLVLLPAACGAQKESETGAGPPARRADPSPGITHLGPVGPDILSLCVRAGRVEHGRQKPYRQQKGDRIVRDGEGTRWLVRNGKKAACVVGRNADTLMTPDRFRGKKLRTAWADRPASYRISSSEDPSYAGGRKPSAVYRKSRPTDMPRSGGRLDMPMEHILYLTLPAPLDRGKAYTIEFLPSRLPAQAFVYDPRSMRSEAVHISHLGFRPDDPGKVFFVSLWMGSGGAKRFREGAAFHVLDDERGTPVHSGTIRLEKPAGEKDEDAYKRNFSGVNVYMGDFSSLQRPGTYRVYVEGVGCSYPFSIGDAAWRSAFYIAARGFYHQRSGIRIGPPHTAFTRPRCFHPEDGIEVYASTTPLINTPNGLGRGRDNFSQLIRGKTDRVLPNAWGGYCDAGDWDRRIQHLAVARLLLDLSLLFPAFFKNLALDIPESGDSLPDIVNEALWGVDFFRRLQTPEGGVRGGIESAGHPRRGEGSWQESWDVMAYAPGVWSSYLYAGAAARASLWLKEHAADMWEQYRDSAVRAMRWAEKKRTEGSVAPYPHQVGDARNLAAAELFRLLGDKKWHGIFLSTTAFTRPGAPVYRYQHHDQAEAAWVYYSTGRPGVNKAVQKNCSSALVREADRRIETQNNTGFKWTKHRWRPSAAGVFTRPDCISAVRAHVITGDEKYLRCAVLACQTGAGANPLNMCYTTGLGHKYPRNVLHIDARVSGQQPPPGLTVCGPMDIQLFGGKKNRYLRLVDRFCYPPTASWPIIENYRDVFWWPGMCEYTVHQLMAPNAYVWGYLAARE